VADVAGGVLADHSPRARAGGAGAGALPPLAQALDGKAEAREAARQHAGRSPQVYPDEDGTVRIRGRLAPEVALLLKALAAARETLYQWGRDEAPEIEPPTLEQQQADALALLAEVALHHELDPGAPGERYQVVVHVDAAVLAEPPTASSARPGRSTRGRSGSSRSSSRRA
jgi:hypothetical protein